MDVHGTKLARTLFPIATGVERGAAQHLVAVERGIAPFSTSLVRRGLTVIAPAT